MTQRHFLLIAISLVFLCSSAVETQERGCREFVQGQRAYRAGRFDEAITKLSLAISLDARSNPNKECDGVFRERYVPFYYLGAAYYRTGQLNKAREMFSKEDRSALAPGELQDLDDFLTRLDGLGAIGRGVLLRVGDDDISLFTEGDELAINEIPMRVGYVDKSARTVRFLGDRNPFFERTINSMRAGSRQLGMWLQDGFLSTFSEPYKRSHAIIVAVGALQRPSPRFEPVPGMVDRAKELANLLPSLGFQRVTTLFNEKATSANVEAELRKFWPGGEYQDVDRVFFYFGGHGTVAPLVRISARDDPGRATTAGVLVTYDYDERRPGVTGLLMSVLREIHARHIAASHLLVALDACHAGLALPRRLSGPATPNQLPRKTLVQIRANVEGTARNILVAGTGDEKAVYKTGGIFTSALIDGLKGAADQNQDRVLEFDELDDYVTREVVYKAYLEGVEQNPAEASLFGEGKYMFIRP